MGAEVPLPNFDGAGVGGGQSLYPCVFGATEGRGGGVERSDRPCTFVGDGAAEGVDFIICWNIEGTDSDPCVQSIPGVEAQAVLGESLLGTRILCGHGGSGRSEDTRLCALSRKTGTTGGAAWLGVLSEIDSPEDNPGLASSGGKAVLPLSGANPKPPALRVDSLLFQADNAGEKINTPFPGSRDLPQFRAQHPPQGALQCAFLLINVRA